MHSIANPQTRSNSPIIVLSIILLLVSGLPAKANPAWLLTSSTHSGVSSSAPNNQSKTDRPNIILVMADDQGWGQTSYNGHPCLKTPNLDAMAANGLRFNRFYAAGPVCSPTRASVLTGRTHRRCGVASHGYALRHNEKTIAQALSRVGYATGHFGKWHLNGIRGPGVPILADDPYRPDQFGFQTWLSVSNFFDMDPIMSRNGVFEEFEGDSSEIIVADALKFIEANAKTKKPSFTVIWYGTPHSPFKAFEKDMQPFSHLNNASKTQLGELVAMDRSIGTLRQGLKDLGIEKNTLIWFTSDNGGLPNLQPSTTGGLRGFKGSVYEGGLRVPGIIEWPERIQPRITNYPAVAMDIFPTISAIVGLEDSDWLTPQDGMSLTPLFDDELKQRSKPFGFSYQDNAAMIDNHLKLVKVRNKKNKGHRFALYDLNQDKTESKNLIETLPEEANRLKVELKSFLASIDSSIDAKDYSEPVSKDHRSPTFWTDHEPYRQYFPAWKKRWEYEKRLKKK